MQVVLLLTPFIANTRSQRSVECIIWLQSPIQILMEKIRLITREFLTWTIVTVRILFFNKGECVISLKSQLLKVFKELCDLNFWNSRLPSWIMTIIPRMRLGLVWHANSTHLQTKKPSLIKNLFLCVYRQSRKGMNKKIPLQIKVKRVWKIYHSNLSSYKSLPISLKMQIKM